MAINEMTNQLGYAHTVDWIQSIVDALFAEAPKNNARSAERLKFATACAPHLFAQALHENSNLEMNWLWYAANLVGTDQRRFCLNRALAINPGSSLARRALAQLPTPAETIDPNRAASTRGWLQRAIVSLATLDDRQDHM